VWNKTTYKLAKINPCRRPLSVIYSKQTIKQKKNLIMFRTTKKLNFLRSHIIYQLASNY